MLVLSTLRVSIYLTEMKQFFKANINYEGTATIKNNIQSLLISYAILIVIFYFLSDISKS